MSDEAKQKHNQADRERYHWLKEHGICTKCGQAWAEPGHVTCSNCYRKYLVWRKRTDPDRSAQLRREQARRQRLREAGICLWCGKEKAVAGRTLCVRCRDKQRETQAMHKLRKKIRQEALRDGKNHHTP